MRPRENQKGEDLRSTIRSLFRLVDHAGCLWWDRARHVRLSLSPRQQGGCQCGGRVLCRKSLQWQYRKAGKLKACYHRSEFHGCHWVHQKDGWKGSSVWGRPGYARSPFLCRVRVRDSLPSCERPSYLQAAILSPLWSALREASRHRIFLGLSLPWDCRDRVSA